MSGTSDVTSGVWPPGLAYLRLGAGEQLLFLPGLSGDHRPPAGRDASFQLREVRPFAADRDVVWLNRRNGLTPPVTMADLAADYATVIRTHLRPPLDVLGHSTGGSVALQLAIDHPDLVRTLVLASAAYRLSDHGRRVQREVAANVRAGRPRRAGAVMFAATGSGPAGATALRALGWAMGRSMFSASSSDLLAVIEAEDGFDVGDRLAAVTARTLVIGGERDRFYSPGLFRDTAARIPNARLLLYPRVGHMRTTMQRRYARDVLAFLGGE